MSPVPLLFLLLATQNQESTATITEVNSGQNFIFAFPENIAYYHPVLPVNTIQITTLYDNTVIKVKHAVEGGEEIPLYDSATPPAHSMFSTLELTKSKFSNSTIHISSDKDILVYVISQKSNSVQTALLTPVEKLGTEYLIPPVPKIVGTTEPVVSASTQVTERGPFRLIIINSELLNSVTIEGTETRDMVLNPYEIAQIWVKAEEALRVVKAEQAVAVYFGHPCAIRYNCTCGMLFTPLPPAQTDKLNYIIPPAFTVDAETETVLLVSEQESTSLSPISPGSMSKEVSGSAILYRPGLLLHLIPEQEFGSCYVLEFMKEVKGQAVIVVNKGQTDGVYDGALPVASPVWEAVPGTDYVSTMIPLITKMVLWHKYSKMAVYFSGMNGASVFGHPAPVVSKTPDFRGCVLSPEVIEIGDVADGWREAVSYCGNKSLELISMDEEMLQNQVYEHLSTLKSDATTEVWIGMRRSSLTGEWYWLSDDAVNATNWGPGEPGTPQEGQCAMMSLEAGFSWNDEDCCKPALPVCYKKPSLYNI